MKISQIIEAFDLGRIRITDHADEEAAADGLHLTEIIHTLKTGEIIERYSTDKPYPSCLVLDFTQSGDPVHTVWAYDEGKLWAILITVYRPDPNRWIQWKERKRR